MMRAMKRIDEHEEKWTNESSNYVIYGLLQKNHDYVDWIRVVCDRDWNSAVASKKAETTAGEGKEELASVAVAAAAAADVSSSIENNEDFFRELDVRAFRRFKQMRLQPKQQQQLQQQEPFNDAKYNKKDSTSNVTKGIGISDRENSSRFSFEFKKLKLRCGLCIVSPNVSPESTSYGIFDSNWNPLRFSPRHSNADVAILIRAATEEQKKQEPANVEDLSDHHSDAVGWKRTSLSTLGNDSFSSEDDAAENNNQLSEQIQTEMEKGNLPLVPVRRSSQQQFLVKQSVNMFFRKESIQFFACFPYRNSPRTICRFEMMDPPNNYNSNNDNEDGGDQTKWNKAITRMSRNTVDIRGSFRSSVSRAKKSGGSQSSVPSRSNDEVARMRAPSTTTTTASIPTSFRSSVSTTKNKFSNFMPSLSLSRSSMMGEDNAIKTSKSDDHHEEEYIIITNAAASTDKTPQSESQEPTGYVAVTIDDVPCRFNDGSLSRMPEILDLFDKYNAKATFMLISSFLSPCHEPDMIRLLRGGHELANHGVRDEPLDKQATSVDVFLETLDECNNKIQDLQQKANISNIDSKSTAADSKVPVGVKWFRAPQARYTKIMEEGLAQRNMYNVMCDAYAACPIIEDGPWIAASLSKQIKNGSIAVIHMPEKCGFREYCFQALELLLEDLYVRRNFRVVTVSELQRISKAQQPK
mmetsp:Transcript_829/g.1910  ORF Transcript_829/g.1910 Transcript_829/m.1910 type:complete len:695 (+) Transcript_829:276-2360(+)